MRRHAFVAVALLVVSLFAGIREVQASPTHEVSNYFYDCAMNQNGWITLACNGQWYQGGTQSGAYMWEVIRGCDNFDYSATWYYWNGSTWVEFEGPPGPNC